MSDFEENVDVFYTWVLVGNPSQDSLISVIPNLNSGRALPAREDSQAYRFNLSVGTHVRPQLRASTTAKKWLFSQARDRRAQRRESENWATQDEFLVMSFAPRQEIEIVFGRTCSYDNNYYQFLPVRFNHPCPYQQRFIAIRYLGKSLPQDTSPLGIEVPILRDEEPVLPNLWPHIIRLALSSGQARVLFQVDERTNIDPNSKLGVNAAEGSLFLPPVRRVASDETEFTESKSYFSPNRVELRRALLERSGALTDHPNYGNLPDSFTRPVNPDAPLNVQTLHVTDQPLIRDILLDGGFISVEYSPGSPTKLSLQFVGADHSPQAYRRKFFQEDPIEAPIGPAEFQMLRKELQNDLAQTALNGLNIRTSEATASPRVWLCESVGTYVDTGDPEGGTWSKLDAVAESLGETPIIQKTFRRLVTDIPGVSGIRTSADNDLAEKLFIIQAWRYPSGDSVKQKWAEEPPVNQGWRKAVVDQLLDSELGRSFMGPEDRVRRWNTEKSKAKYRIDQRGGCWIVEIPTQNDEAEVWKTVFLLPLGSVIMPIAKSLLLDHETRSRLDCGLLLG